MTRAYPRVLHALAPGPAGGLESVVQAHARGWVGAGGEAGAVLMVDAGAPPPPEWRALAEAGVRVVPCGVPHRAYLRERAGYLAAIRDFRPDVVHCHGYRADLLAGWAARRAGVARVSTVHGFTGGDWKNRLYERLQLRSFRRFDAVIAVSRPIVDRLTAHGVPAPLVHCIPNAWGGGAAAVARDEARARLGLPAEGFVVGWVGRLSQEKAADTFVAALAALADPAVTAVVVGDGRERAALEAQAAAAGLGERLRWAGLVPEAGRYFGALDAYVLSSRTEGTPIALFEAMAAGVPIVSTRVGGVPDVVSDAEALLVPPDDPAALAAAIGAVRRDPAAARARAGRASRVLGERYALGPWLERHAELYRAIRQRHPKGAA